MLVEPSGSKNKKKSTKAKGGVAKKKAKEIAPKRTCFYCGKSGHWRRNYKTYLKSFIHAARGVFRNQKNLYLFPPTVVTWLIQYSSSRVEHRDEFSSHK